MTGTNKEATLYSRGVLDRALRNEWLSDGGLALLCMEPGYGDWTTFTSVVDRARSAGYVLRRCSLRGGKFESVVSTLNRLARDVTSIQASGDHAVVSIDGFGPCDDDEAEKIVKVVRRIVRSGASVLLVLLPEADTIIELCHEAPCIYTADLLGVDDRGPFFDLVHNIAPLQRAFELDPALGVGGREVPFSNGAYSRALVDCLTGHFRQGLSDEERSRRLAMVLLGSGTFNDLTCACAHVDSIELLWLEQTAPAFGISSIDSSFCVVGVSRDSVFGLVAPWLVHLIAEDATVALRVAEVLCREGRYRRAGLLLQRIDQTEDSVAIVLKWGCSLLFAGCRELVEDAVGTAQAYESLKLSDDYERCVSVLCLLSDGRSRTYGFPMIADGLTEATEDDFRIWGLESVCELLKGGTLAEDPSAGGFDLALARHVSSLSGLLSGRFESVYKDLMDSSCPRDPKTLSEALTCADYYATALMLGERVDPALARDYEQALTIIKDASPKRLWAYCMALDDVAAVLAGGSCELKDAEKLIARAERCGDAAVQVVFLAVSALADLRSGVEMRAHARSLKACEVSRTFKNGYLAAAAAFVHEAVSCAVGGPSEQDSLPEHLRTIMGERGPVQDMLRILQAALGKSRKDIVRLDVFNRRLMPIDGLWLLNVLVRDAGVSPERLASIIPRAWMNFHEGRAPREADSTLSEPGRAELQVRGHFDEGPRVSIGLLGNFSVDVDGEQVRWEDLRKRRARELVAFLSVARGHRVTRRQALLAIWGDSDYATGMQRIYESVTQVRRALGARERGFEPITSNKKDGTIALNMDVVACDVDVFQTEARAALEGGGAEGIVSHASAAWEIYGSGLSVFVNDVSGTMGQREQELERLYVNALCSGAAAALSLGRCYLAAKFATEVLRIDQYREDAAMSLIEALDSLGRVNEIADLEKRYRKAVKTGARQRSEMLEQTFRSRSHGAGGVRGR